MMGQMEGLKTQISGANRSDGNCDSEGKEGFSVKSKLRDHRGKDRKAPNYFLGRSQEKLVAQAIPLLVGCPAWLRNFLNLFCELCCSPNHSLFINATSTSEVRHTNFAI